VSRCSASLYTVETISCCFGARSESRAISTIL
jgi:hypothetical protein